MGKKSWELLLVFTALFIWGLLVVEGQRLRAWLNVDTATCGHGTESQVSKQLPPGISYLNIAGEGQAFNYVNLYEPSENRVFRVCSNLKPGVLYVELLGREGITYSVDSRGVLTFSEWLQLESVSQRVSR